MAVSNNLGEEIFLVVCQEEKGILFSAAAHTAQWKGLVGNSTVVLIPLPLTISALFSRWKVHGKEHSVKQ